MIKKLTKTIVVGTLVMSLGIVNVFANSYKVNNLGLIEPSVRHG